MNNKEKIQIVAQLLNAMGLTGTKEEKIRNVKALIEELGLSYAKDVFPVQHEEATETPSQSPKPKAPRGFELAHYDGTPIAWQKGAFGVVFCLEGKHFVFSLKSERRMSLLEAQKATKKDKFGTIDGYHWIIPTVPMFETVQKNVQQFNKVAEFYSGDKIDRCEYLDASMTDPCKIGTLRLAMWAPWLDE